MNDIPEPPVPAGVDLSKIDGFMLNTVRLLGSELAAISTGDEFKAAVLLWCRAWQQKPAASLPDDDRVLASFAMATPSRWLRIKAVAMRGFVLCSDGRYYHRVLAEDAARAWKAVSQRREAIRKRYENATAVPTAVGDPYYGDTSIRTTSDRTGTEVSKEERKEVPPLRPPPSPTTTEPAPDGALSNGATIDAKATRGTRLPPDWSPSPDDHQFAINLGLEPYTVAAKFRDYWHATPGAKGVKLDWSATWRNWCRRERERVGQPHGGGRSGNHGQSPGGVMAAAARIIARRNHDPEIFE